MEAAKEILLYFVFRISSRWIRSLHFQSYKLFYVRCFAISHSVLGIPVGWISTSANPPPYHPHPKVLDRFIGFSKFIDNAFCYKVLSTLRRRNLKTAFSLWKHIKCFPFTLRRRNLKAQQSPVILELCLGISRAGKSHDCRNFIIYEKLRYQNVVRPNYNAKPAFSNSSRRSFWKSTVFATD